MHMTNKALPSRWVTIDGHQRPDCARRRERYTARTRLRPVRRGTQKSLLILAMQLHRTAQAWAIWSCFHVGWRADAGGRNGSCSTARNRVTILMQNTRLAIPSSNIMDDDGRGR